MEPELKAKLDEIEAKVDAAYKAANSARRYLMWTAIISIAVIVLPLIGLVFAIPVFIHSYVAPLSSYSGGQQPSVQGTMQELNALGL